MKVRNKFDENYLDFVRNVLYKRKNDVSKDEKDIADKKLKVTNGPTNKKSALNIKLNKGKFKAKIRLQENKPTNQKVSSSNIDDINNGPLTNDFKIGEVRRKAQSPPSSRNKQNIILSTQVKAFQSAVLSQNEKQIDRFEKTENSISSKGKVKKKLSKKKIKDFSLKKTLKTDKALWMEGNTRKVKINSFKKIEKCDMDKTNLKNKIKDSCNSKKKNDTKLTLPTQKPTPKVKENIDLPPHFFENGSVGIKGLKFNKFCSQYIPIHNELNIGHEPTLSIPKRHYKVHQNDLENLEISELNDKYAQKINILDIQIIKPDELNDNALYEEHLEKVCEIDMSMENNLTDIVNSTTFNESIEIKECQKLRDVSKNSIHIKLLDNSIVVIIHPGEKIYIYGFCMIEVLVGEVGIFGSVINKTSGAKKLYSPRGSSLLFIENNKSHSSDETVLLKSILKELLPQENTDCVVNKNSAVVLCKELKEGYLAFLENHASQKVFPDSHIRPRIDFPVMGAWNILKLPEKLKGPLANILPESKIIIAGGKGVGKSTYLRYAVNSLLQKFNSLRVIDLDPGQPEFTPPGVISIVEVNQPLLGPNYTHHQTPNHMVLSHVNVNHNIKKYLLDVENLLRLNNTASNMPTLVNFMGFTTGFGLDIAIDLIRLIQPSILVQIDSTADNKNYQIELTPENVNGYEGNEMKMCGITKSVQNLDYTHVALGSLSEQNESWSMDGRWAREINMYSYLGKMVTKGFESLNSPDIKMHSINLSALSIVNIEGQAISPMAINASIVALCSPLNHDGTFSAHGYGLVRGIDMETDTLILLTPEPLGRLARVSHLVLGSVHTPPSLLMRTVNVEGEIPYIRCGETCDFGSFTRRSYLPPMK